MCRASFEPGIVMKDVGHRPARARASHWRRSLGGGFAQACRADAAVASPTQRGRIDGAGRTFEADIRVERCGFRQSLND
jgi:hypothetical protein